MRHHEVAPALQLHSVDASGIQRSPPGRKTSFISTFYSDLNKMVSFGNPSTKKYRGNRLGCFLFVCFVLFF